MGLKHPWLAPLDVLKTKDGMLGSIYFTSVECADGTKQKLVVKTNTDRQEYADYVTTTNLDKFEVNAYNVVHQALLEFEKQFSKKPGKLALFLPKVYYANYYRKPDPPGFLLIMEDLSVDYQMIRMPGKGLEIDKIMAGLKAVAVFNATSHAYSQKKGLDFGLQWKDILLDFNSILTDFVMDEMMTQVDQFKAKIKKGELKRYVTEKELPLLANLQANMPEIFREVLSKDSTEVSILCHGDSWANNIMFHKSESRCKLLDWQFICDVGCFVDFGLFVLTSAHPDVLEPNLDLFYETYYNAFAEVCVQDFGAKLPWKTLETFKVAMEKKAFIFTLIWELLSYEVLVNIDGLEERIAWCFAQAIRLNPEAFNR